MALRKIISLLLVLLMIITSSISVFSAANFDDDGNRTEDNGLVEEEEGDSPTQRERQEHYYPDDVYIPDDVTMIVKKEVKEKYDYLSEYLEMLGVWDKPEGQYVEKVRRGDFANMLLKFMNISGTFEAAFSDVEDESQCAGSVGALYNLGVVKGTGLEEFRPNDYIIYQEAVTMLLRAMGYEVYAQAKGEYPASYLNLAAVKNLTSAEAAGAAAVVNRKAAIDLLFAAMDVRIFDRVSYGSNFEYKEGDKALYYFHKIIKEKGIINSVNNIFIEGGTELRSGKAMINDVLLEYWDSELASKLGHTVTYFYKTSDNGDNELLLIRDYDTSNNVLEIENEQKLTFSGGSIRYTEDNRDKSARLKTGIKAIINYFAPSGFDAADIEDADSIRLIDNNKDGIYDVMFIFNTDTYLVTGVNALQNRMFDYYTKNEIAIDFNNDIIVDKSGNEVESYYLKDMSVVSVGYNKAKDKRRIIVSNSTVYGKVTEIINETTQKLIVNDIALEYSSKADYLSNDNVAVIGKDYTFYLDYRGKITAFLNQKNNELQYGFLIMAKKSKLLSTGINLKIYSYIDEMQQLVSAERIILDGKKISSDKLISELEEAVKAINDEIADIDSTFVKPDANYNNDALYVRKPVMYRLNDAGEVVEIDTPFVSDAEDLAFRDSQFGRQTLTRYNDFIGKSPGGSFTRNVMAFVNDGSHNVAVASDLKVFIVPVSNDFKDIDDSANYKRERLTYFKSWASYPEGVTTGQKNRLEAYNVQKNRLSPMMVYYKNLSSGTPIDKDTPITVVTKVFDTIDEDGISVKMLKGYQGVSEVNFKIADGFSLEKKYRGPDDIEVSSTVKRGDIIRIEKNYKGEICNYVKVFSLHDEDDPSIVKYGNEIGTTVDTGSILNSLVAVSGNTNSGYNVDLVYTGSSDSYATAEYRTAYRTVLYRNNTNLVLKAADGSTEICDMFPFNTICIDKERDKIYIPNPEEVITSNDTNDEAAAKVILNTGGGKQRMLVLIK